MRVWPFSTLMNPEAGTGTYLAAAWVACIVPAIAIGLMLEVFLPPDMLEAVNDAVIDDSIPLALQFALIIVAAPIIETLVMVVAFAIMQVLRVPLAVQVVLQAVGWGIAHGSIALAWGFAPTWLFFIFSIVYVTQRKRSGERAFWMTAAVHGLNNATASVGLAVELAS